MSCKVCLEEYSAGERAPLFLPCGHTFCRPCLVSLRLNKAGDFSCPVCMKSHRDLQVEQLSVNYDLLTVTSSLSTQTQHDRCETHKDDLKYWCCDCNRALCGLCLNSASHVAHKVLLVKEFLENKKSELGETIGQMRKEVKKLQENISDDFRKLEKEMWERLNDTGCLNCSLMNHLQKIDADVTSLLPEVNEASTIDQVFMCQARLEYIETRTRKLGITLLGRGITHRGKGIRHRDKETSHNEDVTSDTEYRSFDTEDGASDTEDEISHNEDEASDIEDGASAAVIRKKLAADAKGFRANLDYCDDRLLLLSLSHHAEGHLSVLLPSEVFLELSAGSLRLGRVYIQLKSNLRRARQMLALCLGFLGPSYTGAPAYKFRDKDYDSLGFPFYGDADEYGETRGLINGLEWGGDHCIPGREGLVVADDDGKGEASFEIFINVSHDFTANCAFGEVTSGLDVAREAFSQDLVKTVTITKCGVVLPDLGDLSE